jgi:hypothetical protein
MEGSDFALLTSRRVQGVVSRDSDYAVTFLTAAELRDLDACKLASLGWQSTPVKQSIAETVKESVTSGSDGNAFDPGRAAEEQLLDSVAG